MRVNSPPPEAAVEPFGPAHLDGLIELIAAEGHEDRGGRACHRA